MERALVALDEHRDAWAATSPAERIAILDQIRRGLSGVADRWIDLGLQAKGNARGTFAEGEEWVILGAVFALVGRLARPPQLPRSIKEREDGRLVARLFPPNRLEALLFPGLAGNVRFEPGIAREEILGPPRSEGGVRLVLGAGNISAIPACDTLHALFVEGHVVALKMNPVNAHLGPLIEEAFAAVIDRCALRVLYGGAEEGAALCADRRVSSIHLTGSDKTYEAVASGPGAGKPITAELGCVSPVIVVPGPWTESDLEEQGVQLATWLSTNAGFNCVTPRVLIQHEGWPLRERFMNAIGATLSAAPTRRAWYPASREIHAAFVHAHPEARRYGDAGGDRLPWTLIPDVDPARRDDPCFRTEAFCGLLAETALAAGDACEFLSRAVSFANRTLWGNLAASIVIHPETARDPEIARALDRAVDDLRYRTIGVNVFPGYPYVFMLTPWGAYPGNTRADIQSGTGVVNNPCRLRHTEKAVFTGPFRRRDPLTVRSKRPHELGRRLAQFHAAPSYARLARVAWTALRC